MIKANPEPEPAPETGNEWLDEAIGEWIDETRNGGK